VSIAEEIEMSTARTRPELDQWPRRRLLDVGLPPALARVVASDARYDLHALLVLVDCGCDPVLAVRILAPLEEPAPC
jgi:hypothetical protein